MESHDEDVGMTLITRILVTGSRLPVIPLRTARSMNAELEGAIIDATECFVRRHGAFVRDLVERYVPEADVDDVVQQIFVVAWRQSTETTVLEAPLAQQRAWLYQTARFHVRTHRRGARRRRRLAKRLVGESQSLLDGRQLDPRISDALHRSIQRLPVKDWEILEARHYDGMNTAEIALWLDITHEAVRQRLSRAMSTLRTVFEREVGR